MSKQSNKFSLNNIFLTASKAVQYKYTSQYELCPLINLYHMLVKIKRFHFSTKDKLLEALKGRV